MLPAPWPLIITGLFRPAAAGQAWSHRPPPWWQSLLLAVLPLVALSVMVQVQLLQIYPPALPKEGMPVLSRWGLYIGLTSVGASLALAVVASLLADAFDGRGDLDAATATVALALVPVALARMVWPLPLGYWLSLALLGWSLWLLYKALGPALRFSSGHASHLFASLMGMLLCALAIGWQIRDLIPGAAPAMRMGRLWLI